MKRRTPFTQFGQQITQFCAKTGITKRELALMAGVPYSTLLVVCTGKRPGHAAVPAIRAAMDKHQRKRPAAR